MYIRRQAANFIVTQSQLSQAMQSEEILQARRREKKKQDLDLSTTRTREPFANKSQWIATQLVRFRGHKSLGGCHLLVP